MTVHLVNLTNPMMMKGPFREFIPIGAQKMRVRLPGGKRAKKIHFLVSGKAAKVKWIGHDVELVVPSILDHEVVAIDL
jgi:hypothetical protein